MSNGNMVNKKNAFVKKEQATMKSMMGDRPGAPAPMKKFNAYMSNDGDAAESLARSATEGLDKKAFPVS